VTLSQKSNTGEVFRVRTCGPWTTIGEIGAVLGYRSIYDATVNKTGLIYKLNNENRKRLEKEKPEMTVELQKLLIIMMGEQLIKTNRSKGSLISH
jgi:hypothetical protein